MDVSQHNSCIEATEFNYVVQKLRTFFLHKGFVEVSTQHRLSILAACEDPTTISLYDYNGTTWPLPQTGQMWLEHEMLKNPNNPGYFCVSTSYRNEPHPISGRHNLIFPMFEFEMKGGYDELINMEKELITYLGYTDHVEKDYMDVVEKYQAFDLTHDHEQQLYSEFGSAFFLKKFPTFTSPFWNMQRFEDARYAKKIDVILSGMETIGSAERSCDKQAMRDSFHTISNGEYAKLLYSKFGKDRVEAELEEFLQYDFIPRSGGGIGVTRLISSMKKENLIPLRSSIVDNVEAISSERIDARLHSGDINSRAMARGYYD